MIVVRILNGSQVLGNAVGGDAGGIVEQVAEGLGVGNAAVETLAMSEIRKALDGAGVAYDLQIESTAISIFWVVVAFIVGLLIGGWK